MTSTRVNNKDVGPASACALQGHVIERGAFTDLWSEIGTVSSGADFLFLAAFLAQIVWESDLIYVLVLCFGFRLGAS